MQITRITVERIVLVAEKSFQEVLSAIKNAVGHPDMIGFWGAVWAADSSERLAATVTPNLAANGLMQFEEFDDGRVMAIGEVSGVPQAMRLLIGNPLIMKQMAELVPDAAAYAPVTILVDERHGGVHLSYDRMASLLSVYGNEDVLKIAVGLDAKIEALMRAAL